MFTKNHILIEINCDHMVYLLYLETPLETLKQVLTWRFFKGLGTEPVLIIPDLRKWFT